MKVYTYAELRDKILKELSMQDEVFVDPDEMVGYCNDAIDSAEEEIHKLNEDYFLTNNNLNLVLNKQEYKLPSDMYANKIRSIIFNDGTNVYPVKKLRGKDIFEEIAYIENESSDQDYQYLLLNPSATKGYRLCFYPNIRETSSTNMTIWYIRNANRIPLITEGSQSETDDSLVDIPEFHRFVVEFIKERILFKEGGPRYEEAAKKLEGCRISMVDTLTEKVIDDDTEVKPDFTHYSEHN